MTLLKRVLYVQAAVTALFGVSVLLAPRFVLETVLDQVRYPDYAWIRFLGIDDLALAMLMVLVAHRADDVWWWSWAFVIPTGAVAAISIVNALFGLPEGSSSIVWWLLAATTAGFTVALLLGLARTGQERPLP
jgi:hypothetical protein